jgi:hypothetical protein
MTTKNGHRDALTRAYLGLLASDCGPRSRSVGEKICRERHCANVLLVCSHNGHTVLIGLRMQILQALLKHGPMSLGQLLHSVRSECDPTLAVMALACAGLLCLDVVSQPLGSATKARSRQ